LLCIDYAQGGYNGKIMAKGYVLGTVAKNEATRRKKASKIIKILREYKTLEKSRVLEIGTGAGYIAHELSKVARKVDSVDIVDDRLIKEGFTQKLVTDEALPYRAASFDIVITNHVLEHVPDQERHLSEIRRVLKPDGVVYLASPNKWWLTDPHYKLPFISWLPRPVSKLYLLIAKRRKWDIYSVSLSRLTHLAHAEGFHLENKAWQLITHPESFGIQPSMLTKFASWLPKKSAKWLLYVVPTHLVVLVSKEENI